MMKPLAQFHDIHAHLADGANDAPDGVLVSLTPPEARRVLSHDGTHGRFSVGVHPWATEKPVDWEELERFLTDDRVVAVGECGLDALRGAPIDRQTEIFRRQIELSERLGLPMILHIVKAVDRMLALRKEMRPLQPWILHGFRGNEQQAAQLVRAGLSLSLGSRHNPAAVAAIPADHLYRETDAPAPAPSSPIL